MPTKELAIKAVIAADDQFTSKMQKIAGRAKSIGKGLTVGLSLPLAGVGIAAVKASTDFNASMANVATLIPGSIGRVEELKESVQDLSIETGKSTEDLAGGLFQVISAFGDSADTAKILSIQAKAAVAGLATTADALELTSAVTKGYGDTSAAAVQKASDLAFMTNKLGQTTFPELAGSLGRVIPLAAELNVSQEELFGVMATATGVTGKAAEVSTQFRGVLQSLLSPLPAMNTLIKKSGFESGKAILQQKGLQGTLELITRAAKETGLPLQKFIGSIEGQTLALALTGAQAEVLTQKTAAMKEATGATEEAFAEQTQGINKVGFTMKQVTAKISVASQRLGDGLAPALIAVLDRLMPVIDIVGNLAKEFSVLDPGLQSTILAFVGVVGIAGPLLVVLGSIASAVGTVGTVFKTVGVFMLTNPLGIILTVLAGAAFLIMKNWDVVGPFFTKMGEEIKAAFKTLEPVIEKFSAFMEWLGLSQTPEMAKSLSGAGNRSAAIARAFAEQTSSSKTSAVKPVLQEKTTVPAPPVLPAAPGTLLPVLPSALPQTGEQTLNGQIRVSFENAPPGTRVREARVDQPGIDVPTDVGMSFADQAVGAS